ncbi:MAG: glycoside hydrolase family 16 protein [Marmoricola sp.]
MKYAVALVSSLLLVLALGVSSGSAQASRSRGSADASAPTDACGVRPQKPDGSYWSCTFHDEFNGTHLDNSKWMPQTRYVSGSRDAHACYTDSARNVSESGGSLNLTIRREDSPIFCAKKKLGSTADYSSGSVMGYHRWSQEYGRFEARIKAAPTSEPGLQETWWLWPDERYDNSVLRFWPAAGEFDISETYSMLPGLSIPYLHYTLNDNGGAKPGINTSYTCKAQRGEWNTYALTWSPDRIAIATNGKTCLVNTSGNPAFKKRYIMAFTQALGHGKNAPTSKTPFPATMKVDWVRVWK